MKGIKRMKKALIALACAALGAALLAISPSKAQVRDEAARTAAEKTRPEDAESAACPESPPAPAALPETPQETDEEALERLARELSEAEQRLEAAKESLASAKAAIAEKNIAIEKIKSAGRTALHEMKVLRATFDGEREFTIELSEEPDMDAVRRYITVEPVEKGKAAFAYGGTKGSWISYKPATVHELRVSGEFPHRTDIELHIRKGLPVAGLKDGGKTAVYPLAADFNKTVRRKDRSPAIGFADSGRYLPPAGKRAISVRSVNVPGIDFTVRKIPSANIVPMLALEEDAFECITRRWWVENEQFVLDLSVPSHETAIECANALNEEETHEVRLLAPDSSASNGVYLAHIQSKGSNEEWVAPWFKTVCVTDLGISVRVAGKESDRQLLVWIASLTSGRPVDGVAVQVYSKENGLVMHGTTGADGICRPVRVAAGDPFAVVAVSKDGSDTSFIQLARSMKVSTERFHATEKPDYLADGDFTAFVWTDRGIYRHGETIHMHALVRGADGAAPAPFPVRAVLRDPRGRLAGETTLMPDANGSMEYSGFSVAENLPSGTWEIELSTPQGKDGRGASNVFGARSVRIEEFVPPQIRVAVETLGTDAGSFGATVSAMHLYGAAAAGLVCECAIGFEDVPFSPAGWEGWSFGDESAGLKPNFNIFGGEPLDGKGEAHFHLPVPLDIGRPRAAIRATVQGTVFEDGGRGVSARASAIIHENPFYIGAAMSGWMKKPSASHPAVPLACVDPDGGKTSGKRTLCAGLVKTESVYTWKTNPETGWNGWDCERVEKKVAEGIEIETDDEGLATLVLPADEPGDYILSVEDAASGVVFRKSFYLSESGSDECRGSQGLTANLSTPERVQLGTDKEFYRPGEKPLLRVRSPFAGCALLTVFREGLEYARTVELEDATAEIELDAVEGADAPNIDVSLLVTRGPQAGDGFAARAHGETTVRIRRPENELETRVEAVREGGKIRVSVRAPGAEGAVVALVDQGINMLTDEPVPDPVAFFSAERSAERSLYDLHGRLLPVLGLASPGGSGAKTGGGTACELFDRLSPVTSRRFRPLALWSGALEMKDGVAETVFELPEFAGETRAAAVAFSRLASGGGAARCKVASKIVFQPDAPRFVAPGDEFDATLPLANNTGDAAEIEYSACCDFAGADGAASAGTPLVSGCIRLDAGERACVRIPVKAPGAPGELTVKYRACGLGETHEDSLHVPVRPACAWREKSGVAVLAPGKTFAPPEGAAGSFSKSSWTASPSGVEELRDALEWLAEYPHGCLEQTSSRVFPLIAAGGFLNSLGSAKGEDAANAAAAGVARVKSMMRENDFTMWPDCDFPPWDCETSLYAAHFLAEADKAGIDIGSMARNRLLRFLRNWAAGGGTTGDGSEDKNETRRLAISAYACHTLAIMDAADKDRMFTLYDSRGKLDLLSRARLARAFAAIGDRRRAGVLLENASSPSDVREAAFAMLALLETNPDDDRIHSLAAFLQSRRDKERFSWGTTGENAHALLALGEYWRRRPVRTGKPDVVERDGVLFNAGDSDAFVSWKLMQLPSAGEDAEEPPHGIMLEREYLDADGNPYDLANAKRGDLVITRITLTAPDERWYNDLVVEDLFPAALEPVHSPGVILKSANVTPNGDVPSWLMRSDVRDDRLLLFSYRFHAKKGDKMRFHQPMRVVSSGRFAVPQCSVEAMYQPGIRARLKTSRMAARP